MVDFEFLGFKLYYILIDAYEKPYEIAYLQTINICATLSKNYYLLSHNLEENHVPKKTTAKAKPKAKATAKKTTVKKAAAPKKRVAEVVKKLTAVADKQTKAQIIADIAEDSGVDKKFVKAVFVSLQRQIQRHLVARGSGELTIPEIAVKVRRVRKPLQKRVKVVTHLLAKKL